MTETESKYSRLLDILRGYGRAAIAYSSGVDSTFLLHAAIEALGQENVIALTAKSCLFPIREFKEAAAFCEERGVRHLIVEKDETAIEGFSQNPPDRCYICKKDLFSGFLTAAEEAGFPILCEGSNMDDTGDYRPGLRAIAELKVKSPLREAGLYKKEIRKLSREAGLSTSEKPSFACLASRFVYGETITKEKLAMVDAAEQLLLDLGFTQFRVRIHGSLARIELKPDELPRLLDPAIRSQVSDTLHALGFLYVSADLDGYVTGSMNKALQ